MIQTDKQRRGGLPRNLSIRSRSRRGGRKNSSNAWKFKGVRPEEVEAYADERLKHEKDLGEIAFLKALKSLYGSGNDDARENCCAERRDIALTEEISRRHQNN